MLRGIILYFSGKNHKMLILGINGKKNELPEVKYFSNKEIKTGTSLKNM